MSAIFERVKELLAEHLVVDAAKVTPEARIVDDLGADSLDIVELVMAAEDWFAVEVTDDDARGIKTVADVVALVERLVGERRLAPDLVAALLADLARQYPSYPEHHLHQLALGYLAGLALDFVSADPARRERARAEVSRLTEGR